MSERKPAAQDPTIGHLVADVSRDLSALIQHEVQLAKSELKVSARAGGIGAVLLAGAAFILLLVLILGSITIGFFLTMTGLHAAWAFLIVTGAYLLLAVLLALIAIGRFKKVKPPTRTIQTAKQIPDALKGRAN